jgi:hypothetical protein
MFPYTYGKDTKSYPSNQMFLLIIIIWGPFLSRVVSVSTRGRPRPIPFPRGSSVFLMGIVYTFVSRQEKGGAGHGGVRPRPYSYPTWTIYIPPTIQTNPTC